MNVVGNLASWRTLSGACARKNATSSITLIRGPPGTGKSYGVLEVARFCRRRCIHVQCAELAATDRNKEELGSELSVTATRRSHDDDELAPILFLDDVDSLVASLAPPLVAFLKDPPKVCGPIVLACGRSAPRWIRDIESASTLHLAPLLADELKAVARAKGQALPSNPRVTEACVRAAGGDARLFLNSLFLHATSSQASGVQRITPNFNEWVATSYILFGKMTPEGIDHVVATQDWSKLSNIIHANYVDALVSGCRVDSQSIADQVADRVDLFSAAHAMANGQRQPTAGASQEAVHILTHISMGGEKTMTPWKRNLRRLPASHAQNAVSELHAALNATF